MYKGIMDIKIYNIDQRKEWDRIVKSFLQYDVYYLSGYAKAFQIHGDGLPLLFYYEDKDIRGINVVMKRDIADDLQLSNEIDCNKFFDFVTPYGYGGWLIEGDGDKKSLFLAYESWCRKNNIVSEFVRCHPILNNAEMVGSFYEVVTLGATISMDLSSPDVIWSNLTSKNRNMIRKAQKFGVEIYHGRYRDIYMTFKEMYNSTMDSNNAKEYYYFEEEFYNSICDDLKEEAQIFWAEIDGKIIAASIMIYANGYMNYHLSGSLREYQNVAPSNLLLYRAALWGYDNGYRSLHLGGGVGSKEDSLFKFKSAFNRKETKQFAIGKKIFLNDVYDELTHIRIPNVEGDFFPKYRA